MHFLDGGYMLIYQKSLYPLLQFDLDIPNRYEIKPKSYHYLYPIVRLHYLSVLLSTLWNIGKCAKSNAKPNLVENKKYCF